MTRSSGNLPVWFCAGCNSPLAIGWRCSICDAREYRDTLESDVTQHIFGLSSQGNVSVLLALDLVQFGKSRSATPEQLKRHIGRVFAGVVQHHPEIIDRSPMAHLTVALQRLGVVFGDPGNVSGSWLVDVIGHALFSTSTRQTF